MLYYFPFLNGTILNIWSSLGVGAINDCTVTFKDTELSVLSEKQTYPGIGPSQPNLRIWPTCLIPINNLNFIAIVLR